MPAVGEVEQHTGNPFWGSGSEEVSCKGDIGVGENRAYWRRFFWPAGQGRQCPLGLGGSRGSAASAWGSRAVQLRLGVEATGGRCTLGKQEDQEETA
jgi:hypothetical protein